MNNPKTDLALSARNFSNSFANLLRKVILGTEFSHWSRLKDMQEKKNLNYSQLKKKKRNDLVVSARSRNYSESYDHFKNKDALYHWSEFINLPSHNHSNQHNDFSDINVF